MGDVGPASRSNVLVHEQLAFGAARREPSDGRQPRVERAFAHRTLGRKRPAFRSGGPLESRGMARERKPAADVSRTRRGHVDRRTACLRMVFPRHVAVVSRSDRRRLGVAALPRRLGNVFRHRPRPRLPLQHHADVAPAALDSVGCNRVSRCRHFSYAHDRRARAPRAAAIDLHLTRGARARGRRKPCGGIRRDPWLGSEPMASIRQPRIRVSRSGSFLASLARSRLALVGGDPVSRVATAV